MATPGTTQEEFTLDTAAELAAEAGGLSKIEGKSPWGASQGGGFGNTLQLNDGRLVSCSSYRGPDAQTHVEVVRWRLPGA